MTTDLTDVIARIPEWQAAKSLTVVDQPGGKTNRNFLVTVDGERFVLRVSGENTAPLGIRRATEREAILAASGIGVAPDVVAYSLPEGHLVTRFIEGVEWSPEEFRRPEVIRRVAATMRRSMPSRPLRASSSLTGTLNSDWTWQRRAGSPADHTREVSGPDATNSRDAGGGSGRDALPVPQRSLAQ